DPGRRAAAELCLQPEALPTATPAQLDEVVDELAGQMEYRRDRPNAFLLVDLKDQIALNGYILLKGGTEHVYVADYRKRVEQRVLQLIDTHPTVAMIGRGEAVTDAQLIDL